MFFFWGGVVFEKYEITFLTSIIELVSKCNHISKNPKRIFRNEIKGKIRLNDEMRTYIEFKSQCLIECLPLSSTDEKKSNKISFDIFI